MPRISVVEKNEVSKEVQEVFTEIVEALGVMELFTAFNKFLDSLNVEVDF
jgi:hypothetical protein